MPYDIKTDVQKVRDYYKSDPLQHRFSALITGESGSGKSMLAHTCRLPVHIDSFDPGGTKCLREWITKGDIVADTRWENEDPYHPKVFVDWVKETNHRLESGYFDLFGTYMLDSATSFGEAAMGKQLLEAGRPGEAPKFTKDYTPQKIDIVNNIKRFMTLKCDFILTGHLDKVEDKVLEKQNGEKIVTYKYRFMTTGKATIVIPLMFDELYVLLGKESSSGVTRKLITDAQGTYVARSRLKALGKLDAEEEIDIKKLLKKIGLNWEDKPKL